MFERFGSISIILGTVLGAIALCWILERFARILLTRGSWKLLRRPALLLLVSVLLTGLPILASKTISRFASLGPLDKIVDGERHLTLTGWDRQDYSVIESRPDTIVLQMANPDVTDETLKFLANLKQLRELDLNNSQVTDAGLAAIAELPALRDLRLARTKITDEGFRKHLLSKEKLLNLELTGTTVASKTLREWKSAEPSRKYLK